MEDRIILVNQCELEELKKQAEEINRRIKELSAPTTIAGLSKVKPYSLPGFIDHDSGNPVAFDEQLYDRDAWKWFYNLGLKIHSKNGFFRERQAQWLKMKGRYVDEIGRTTPKLLKDISQEEAVISAQMIDEMVEIYNRYMVLLHPDVVLETIDGDRIKVPTQELE